MFVEFEGQTVEFPDDVTDDEIGEALSGVGQGTGSAVTASDLVGAGEAALTIGTSVLASPLAGLQGLGEFLLSGGDVSKAAEGVESRMAAHTYLPSTEEGVRTLQSIGKLLEPLGVPAEAFGEFMFEKTQSPEWATAAFMADPVNLLFPALGGVRQVKRAAQRAGLEEVPDFHRTADPKEKADIFGKGSVDSILEAQSPHFKSRGRREMSSGTINRPFQPAITDKGKGLWVAPEVLERDGFSSWFSGGLMKTSDGAPYMLFRGSREHSKTKGPSRALTNADEFGVHFGTSTTAEHFSLPVQFRSGIDATPIEDRPFDSVASALRNIVRSGEKRHGKSIEEVEAKARELMDRGIDWRTSQALPPWYKNLQRGYEEGFYQRPLVTNIKKPIMLYDKGGQWAASDIGKQVQEFHLPKDHPMRDRIDRMVINPDESEVAAWAKQYSEAEQRRILEMYRMDAFDDMDLAMGMERVYADTQMKRILHDMGYDSIAYVNNAEGVGDWSFIIWDNKHLKTTTSQRFSDKNTYFEDTLGDDSMDWLNILDNRDLLQIERRNQAASRQRASNLPPIEFKDVSPTEGI